MKKQQHIPKGKSRSQEAEEGKAKDDRCRGVRQGSRRRTEEVGVLRGRVAERPYPAGPVRRSSRSCPILQRRSDAGSAGGGSTRINVRQLGLQLGVNLNLFRWLVGTPLARIRRRFEWIAGL
jgi:hypothetical protein